MMPTHYIVDAEKDADMKSLSSEEAIAILNDMKIDIPVPKAAVTQRKRNVALDMAIEALSSSEKPNSSDTISRQAAIDALHTWFRDGFDEDKWWNSTHVLAAIEGIPPAEPKRIRGKWVFKNDLDAIPTGYYECSECKIGRLMYKENFCPNCGADMRGEQDE